MVDSYQPLTDPQWQVIEPHLQTKARWRVLSLRSVFDAICFKCRTACQWRALPLQFPPHEAVCYYFYRWRASGLLSRLNARLDELDRLREGREAEPSVLCVDSQSVKLSPRACEHRGIDRHKKVNGRKRHIAVDTGGRIWVAIVTSANRHDGPAGIALIGQMPRGRLRLVVVDKASRGRFARALEKEGIELEIGSRPPTEKGFVPIKNRWVVERTFAWMNYYRELLSDFTYNPASHVAWLMVFNITICLNRLYPN